jgi:hypothetical protein
MKKLTTNLLALLVVFASCTSSNKPAETASAGLPTDSVVAIAKAAYVYGIPLILMDITKKKLTNVAAPVNGKAAPINQLTISTDFPNAQYKDVVRPNADTYYTTGFLDLKVDAMVLSLPNTNGRYYLMPMLDAYGNVFASPGKRTTGTEAGIYLITGPEWTGTVPEGMKQIKAPTNTVWIIGRTQANTPEDAAKVVVPLEKQYILTPLAAYGKPYTPPAGVVDTNLAKTSPNEQVKAMSISDFFNYINQLMVNNAPAAADSSVMAMFKQIGVAPGATFDINSFDTATQAALNKLPAEVFAKMDETLKAGAVKPVNGWVIFMKGMGNYGVDYELRALACYVGLGANLPEDAVYPSCSVDADGNPFDGANKYIIHFDKDKTPPVNGFWSLTMYDNDGYFIENPINIYAVGHAAPFTYNADGSLDIYIQNASPGKDKQNNWLPAPTGSFNVMMRLYWPKEEMLNGAWTPPAIMKVK